MGEPGLRTNRLALATKRALDCALAAPSLIAVAPVCLAAAALIKSRLSEDVFFRQERVGRNDVVFTLIKFKTMSDERDANGELLPDAERLNDLGRFLRKTSIDELPTLLNVLKGDMSLVGPRPLLVEYLPRYTAEQAERHQVKPGITGWAQVNGRNLLDWDSRLELDTWYVRNWSIGLDIQIMCKTVVTVLRRDGISHANHETMPKFMGSNGSKD